MTRQATARRQAAQAVENPSICAVAGQPDVLIAPDKFDTAVTPARPNIWHLWFQADAAIPVELRGRTKNGRPKRQPTRYPPNINERSGMHWRVEGKVVKRWKTYAINEARRQHAMRTLDRARISAIVYRRALGVADPSGDHERLKPLVDGLVEAKVLPDDTRRYVEYGEVEEQRPGHRGEGILLIIEALEPAATGGE